MQRPGFLASFEKLGESVQVLLTQEAEQQAIAE